MGVTQVLIMKCVVVVVSLYMAVAVVTENILYPYPIKSNGSHVCRKQQGFQPCEWLSSDNFTEQFIVDIKANNALFNQTNGTLGDDQGLFGVWFPYFTACFPYCQGEDERPWTD